MVSKFGHGGARPGSGKKKGHKQPHTIERLEHLALVRELVRKNLEPMTIAQIDSSVGLKHFFLRDPKTKQFARITDEAVIERALNDEQENFWIHTKDPKTEAYADLMNRAYGKATERLEADVTHHLGPEIEKLVRGRKRAGNGHG